MSSRGLSRPAGFIVLVASLAAASLPGLAAPARTTARVAVPAVAPREHPLPDTVLAVIGERRTVGVGGFRRAWAQLAPPARPDSLTPQGARRFLDLLIDKETLAERALQENWQWTARESAQVANLRDRTLVSVALDSALAGAAADRAARGEPALEPEPLGVAVRESTVAGLAASYDEALLERLAHAFAALPRPSADSSIVAQLRARERMPAIEAADSARVAAQSSIGDYRTADLLAAWRRLDVLYRPPIESAEQVRDLVKNGLFERALRHDAERHHLERHPRVLEALERQREYLAAQRFVTREVHARIPTDSLTLRRYYDRDPGAWAVPTRVGVVRLLLPGRSEAARMAVLLRDPAAAETLVTRGLRERVDYRAEITAQGDSALFAAAMRAGTGTVLGPDSLGGGWQVVRVETVLPAHDRAFQDVRERVLGAWREEEGGRRLQALLAALRKRTRVVVNEAALARLVADGIPASPQR